MEKLYCPEPPKRFCSRCGAEVTWSDPEGWIYDEHTGKVLQVRIRGTCPTHAQKDGRPHFQLNLHWSTVTVSSTLPGAVRLDPYHWYCTSVDFDLREYCDIPKVERFVKTSQLDGIGTGGTDDENRQSQTG
jgi:hypothetical protein